MFVGSVNLCNSPVNPVQKRPMWVTFCAKFLAVNILLVDDDVELCSLLSEFLTREGFHVECVNDGNGGLERALQPGIDLVVLDVMLPGLDGFEILRRLRARSKVPVMMLTARGE